MEAFTFPRYSPEDIISYLRSHILAGSEARNLVKEDVFDNPKVRQGGGRGQRWRSGGAGGASCEPRCEPRCAWAALNLFFCGGKSFVSVCRGTRGFLARRLVPWPLAPRLARCVADTSAFSVN